MSMVLNTPNLDPTDKFPVPGRLVPFKPKIVRPDHQQATVVETAVSGTVVGSAAVQSNRGRRISALIPGGLRPGMAVVFDVVQHEQLQVARNVVAVGD